VTVAASSRAGANRQLILEHFAAKTDRDATALRAQLADDVRWWAPQSTGARGVARPVEGAADVVALLMTVGLYRAEGRTYTLHHVVADDDAVAAHVTLSAVTVGGQLYENRYVFVFEIRDGLIRQVWEHFDTAYLYSTLDAWSSPTPGDAHPGPEEEIT
jgi:uncharacterized protein